MYSEAPKLCIRTWANINALNKNLARVNAVICSNASSRQRVGPALQAWRSAKSWECVWEGCTEQPCTCGLATRSTQLAPSPVSGLSRATPVSAMHAQNDLAGTRAGRVLKRKFYTPSSCQTHGVDFARAYCQRAGSPAKMVGSECGITAHASTRTFSRALGASGSSQKSLRTKK